MNNDFSWTNGGSQLACLGLGIGLLLLNKKTNNLDERCGKAFGKVSEDIAALENFKHTAFDNFDILAKDINRLGHAVGYKGKLGVNN